MPEVLKVLESSLYVRDLARALEFYRDVLGMRPMGGFKGGAGAALEAGQGSVLLLFRAEATVAQQDIPPHGASGPGHVAFCVTPQEMDDWRRHLRLKGIPVEKEVRFGSNPPSFYFRDPDGNSLELAVASIWPLARSGSS